VVIFHNRPLFGGLLVWLASVYSECRFDREYRFAGRNMVRLCRGGSAATVTLEPAAGKTDNGGLFVWGMMNE
jgi:hypothetical protein